MKKKTLKTIEEFKDLNKKNLINELMRNSIKGGCCKGTATSITRIDADDDGTGLED